MTPSPTLDLSIIIVNWNVCDLLRPCLTSLREQTELAPERYEIHVVDNASTDGGVEMLPAEFPEVKFHLNRENIGFARANNQVFPQCLGRFVMLLNPDTIVIDHAIDRMLRWFRTNSDVGIVGCRLVNADRSFQRAGAGAFPTIRSLVWNYFFLNRLLPTRWAPPALYIEADPQGDTDVDWVSGAALMLRPEALDGPVFDETFFMFGEDMELCQRVRLRGWRVVYTSCATIVHLHGRSLARQESAAVLAESLRGPRAVYVRRHGRGMVRLYDLILFVGYLIRWPVFALASVVLRKPELMENSRDSRRHAWTALRFLLGFKR